MDGSGGSIDVWWSIEKYGLIEVLMRVNRILLRHTHYNPLVMFKDIIVLEDCIYHYKTV
jgi:hypothetical protein